jgi:hypothetical protein
MTHMVRHSLGSEHVVNLLMGTVLVSRRRFVRTKTMKIEKGAIIKKRCDSAGRILEINSESCPNSL